MLERRGPLVASPPADAAPIAVREQPTTTAAVIGELAPGQHLAPLGMSIDAAWYAVPWAGGTGWVAHDHLAPVTAAAGADPSGGLPFDWPVGTPAERSAPDLPRRWYQAVGYNEAYALPGRRRAVHTGLDLNLRSGGDSDLGEPVYAAADGIVTASGAWPVWGNIVLIRHDLPAGEPLWTQYAHLRQRLVRTGDVVRRGQQIGTIGKGQGNRFAAHLHFEVRRRNVSPSYWPGMDHAGVERSYLDPAEVIARSPSEQAVTNAGVPTGETRLWAGTTATAEVPDAWVCLSVPVGEDPAAVPRVDLRPWTEVGTRVVLHLVPGPGDNAFLGAGFARAAAACAGMLTERPWAVLVGENWDAPFAWPDGAGPAPSTAAQSANGSLDLVREALATARLPDVPVGPGPLARRRAPDDPLPWWRAFVADLSDPGIWAVRAWTLGADPALTDWTDGSNTPTDPFNRYRALLEAVPRQFAQRPALLMGVDPSENWDRSGGWLPALRAHVERWNATGGPAARVVLLSSGASPTAACEPAGPWSGLGLFLAEPWLEQDAGEVAARALRATGADFVVRKRLHGRTTLPGGQYPTARRRLTESTPARWGWGLIAGVEAHSEAAAGVALAQAEHLAGWVVEPVPGYPIDAAATYMAALRSGLPERPIGLAWRPRTPAQVVAALAPWADVLMPFVPRTGALASVVSAVRRFDRPVVPVLDLDAAAAPNEFDVFRAHAAATGRPGAGLVHQPGTRLPSPAREGADLHERE